MSLKQSLANAAYAVPMAFAIAAGSASAQDKLPVIEPSSTDLSRPVASACVETTPGQPGLTAWDKLKTVMGARGQLIVGSGDKVVKGVNQRRELLVTISNNFSGKEGYVINSDAPKDGRETSKGFCFSPLATASFVDVAKLDKVPTGVNQGELGQALTNNHKLGSKVAYIGATENGSLYVLHFDPKLSDVKIPKGEVITNGALKLSDAKGGNTGNVAVFEHFDYSAKMKIVLQELANAKPDQRLAGLDERKLAPR